MPQVPTAARKRRFRSAEDEDEETHSTEDFIEDKKKRKPRVSLSNKLLATVEPFPPGFLPRTDDEKREIYLRIIRLRSVGKTYVEVATHLGLSEKTIRNYTAEPMYQELEAVLEGDARQRGYHLISEMILDSYETLFELMKYSSSDFVRYKCAAEILMHGGFGVPREEAHASNRDEAVKFLQEVRERTQRPIQVNVQVNQIENTASPSPHTQQSHGSTATTVEGTMTSSDETGVVPLQVEAPRYEPVLPGGKLPESYRVTPAVVSSGH